MPSWTTQWQLGPKQWNLATLHSDLIALGFLTSSIAYGIAIVKHRVCFLKAPYYALLKYVIRTGLTLLKPVRLSVLYFHWVMRVIQPKQTLQNQGKKRNLQDVAETEEELQRSLVVVQHFFGLVSQQGLFAESDSFLPTERMLGMLEQICAKWQEILKE